MEKLINSLLTMLCVLIFLKLFRSKLLPKMMELACNFIKSMEIKESTAEFICQSVNMFIPDEWSKIVHNSISPHWASLVEIGIKLVCSY